MFNIMATRYMSTLFSNSLWSALFHESDGAANVIGMYNTTFGKLSFVLYFHDISVQEITDG
jgi:hypothetical protein